MSQTTGEILLVDNDEFSRTMTAELLEKQGYLVKAVSDGLSAVTTAQAKPPDLVLLELDLPKLDGGQTIQVLKQNPTTTNIPILVLTAQTGEEVLLRCLRLDADNVLFKPVSREELLLRIERALVRKRRFDSLVSVIQRHLDPSVAYQIMQKPTRRLPMKRAHLAVLFSDLRGFTQVAEKIEPEQTAALLNNLFEKLVGCVLRYGGTLDKFLGDGLMALFGAPIGFPDNESRAVCSALDMLRTVNSIDARFEELTGGPIAMGIGISAGHVVVGPLGSDLRRNYTAIGDPVNVAARLTALAQGREIVICDATRNRLDPQIEVEALEPALLKGKSKPLDIFLVKPDQHLDVILRRKT